ncbi:unnamed protein product [Rotaria sordida]|uniref:SAM domain-containing protein n=1 Tax=Rotaria sordida TaxID=392033 RepID=A0A815BGJ1_9BILA|nr:unnamed protein product [Rotaria sordida]
MSESYPSPPAYDEINRTFIPENSDPNWQPWYRKFIALKFTEQEANEYTRLFVINQIVINMIPELTDAILQSIGIDKAGHRIRILRLQNKGIISTSARSVKVIPQVVNTPRCACHRNIVANEKCSRCKRLVCLNCRREKISDNSRRYYCQECYDECTIL